MFTYLTTTINSNMIDDILDASKTLPIALQARINKRHLATDKAASIQAWLLLKTYLEEQGLNHEALLANIQFSPFGKPSFNQPPARLYFNFSHSDEKVVCAISKNNPIGVDIEKIMPIDVKALCIYFTPAELDFITRSTNQTIEFYSLWTKKEAFLKCMGDGIAAIDLTTIAVLQNYMVYNHTQYTFYPMNADTDYVSWVCLSDA